MTSDILVNLAKMNIALAAAVLAVMVLRSPFRRQFGARAAYAIWLLVPVAVLATQFPSRMIMMASPLSHTPSVIQSDPAWPIESTTVLLAGWLGGALLLLLYFGWAQARFYAAMRAGHAGPAVAGIIRPRIVTPAIFTTQFLSEERAAIIAHEKAHISRQDTRINAAASLLQCLCWFNPLVHVGARLMRVDQEMACDAAVLSRNPSMRRVYAEALLKTQLINSPLPLGCYWPGGMEHPLTRRVTMLKSKPPSGLRRAAGAGAILMASALAGWSAWAAQPPRIVLAPVVPSTLATPAVQSAKATFGKPVMTRAGKEAVSVAHVRHRRNLLQEADAGLSAGGGVEPAETGGEDVAVQASGTMEGVPATAPAGSADLDIASNIAPVPQSALGEARADEGAQDSVTATSAPGAKSKNKQKNKFNILGLASLLFRAAVAGNASDAR